MPPLPFADARAAVLDRVRVTMNTELVPLAEAAGRILAEDIAADRDYPPFHRSARDGFAVVAAETPGTYELVGEVRAGEPSKARMRAGQALEIMTGAPVPFGADAVVMVEHCGRDGARVSTDRKLRPGENVAPRGSEAKAGATVLFRGTRIDYTSVAGLATVGREQVRVYQKPRVAILATGDEIVPLGQNPAAHQIRNSNSFSLAAQVRRAGGIPVVLPIAPDDPETTRELIAQGLEADLLLLSGGVSAGKYDFVEPALAQLGAEFFFDRVLIQPGQPLVFGRARERFLFGLPGNPASTMVTFELFAKAALELIAGVAETSLPLALATLTEPFHHRPGLTRFLPALVRGAEVTPVRWQGSGDVAALCRANAFLVAEADVPEYGAGETIQILFQ